MKDVEIVEVERFIKSLDCKFLIYITYEKSEIHNMIFYYVDNNMKMRKCISNLIFNDYRSFNIMRNHFRTKVNYAREKLFEFYSYDYNSFAKGLNKIFAARVIKYDNYFEKQISAKQFVDEFAHYLCIDKQNVHESSANDMVCGWDIRCDFMNYSNPEFTESFDTIMVEMPLVSRGRTTEQQRDEIRRLRPQLEAMAMNSIKNSSRFQKYGVSIDSLYISKLYHTRDNRLEFIVKIKE